MESLSQRFLYGTHFNRRRQKSFAELAAEAAICTRCPAMCERSAVLSELNGSVDARVMFIGEAPGRKGADRTRVPFSGDQSGENFERFLASIDLKRSEIFITSAALCNPRSASGANRRPKASEIRNCSDFLSRAIELVAPRVIVTLGTVALEALKLVHYHEFTLKHDAGRIRGWNGRLLVPLYHPSPQVLITSRKRRSCGITRWWRKQFSEAVSIWFAAPPLDVRKGFAFPISFRFIHPRLRLGSQRRSL